MKALMILLALLASGCSSTWKGTCAVLDMGSGEIEGVSVHYVAVNCKQLEEPENEPR